MFWDFGSAVSSQRQAAGDQVQKSASRDQQQSQDPQQQRTSGNCSTLPKSTSESTDKENTYEIIRGNNFRVGNIMKCDDDICKDLHDNVMVVNGTDALQGTSERVTKNQNAV